MKRVLLTIIPCVAIGITLGIGTVTANYAGALSYLTTDPKACVNCHIMQPQYDSWQKSGHHTVATCADCHLPTTFPDKYIAKSANGWNHSKAFTLQNFPEPIFIQEKNAAILQANCIRCHQSIVDSMMSAAGSEQPQCVHCHADVGHGDAIGLGGRFRPEEVEIIGPVPAQRETP